jgi:hypothetical protein
MKRSVALGAVVLALGAGGAALGQNAVAGGAAAQEGEGGLSLSPAVMEGQATRTGVLATMTVANRSAKPLTVSVAARPWVQATSGKVAPNRRAKLGGVSVSEGSFTLAPGAEKQVTANLNALPARGAGLYGALEVVGLPTDFAKRKGVVLGYRVVGAIRLQPAVPKPSVSARAIKSSKGTAVLPVKNTGNTLDELTGSISLKDARGTRHPDVPAVKILPGKTVDVPLGPKLSKGTATAKITLNLRGKRVLKLNKKFKVK